MIDPYDNWLPDAPTPTPKSVDFRRLLDELGDDERAAAGVVDAVSAWAAVNGYPELVRRGTPAADPHEVRKYLALCIAATAKPEPDKLLTLAEAAEYLGYTVSGLRKIVDRTKAGKQKPAIQFLQVGRGPIKFRQEWLGDFIAANAVEPARPRPTFEPQHLKR